MNQQQLEALLKELQSYKECEWLEFKVNNGNPDEIGEYLSALSNGACYNKKAYGFLVFGIENGTQRLVGTEFKPGQVKIGNQELENWLATLLDPRVDFKIYEFDYDQSHFAIFRVDAANNIPVKFKGIPYIRIGSYKKKLLEHPERERKIWNDSDIPDFERVIAFENISADDVLSMIDYPAYFEMMQIPLPNNLKGILSKFIEEKFIELNHNGSYNITNLAAILFAKKIAGFESTARKAIRVIVYKGNNRVQTKKEQVGIRGYANGFIGLIKFIIDQLPTTEIVEGPLRREISIFPALAIRELVANAIIHQDFSIKGTSPMIEIFDNRIEITNPGKPLIDPLRFIDHSPQSRNETIAAFMRRLKICEERGSGIDKVVFECEKYKLPAPDFVVEDNFMRVILYSPMSLRKLDRKDKIQSCYLHACLKYVSGEVMTNQSLRERFNIEEKNYPMASRIINDTKEAGLIKDYDPNNKSKPLAKYLPFWV